MQNAKVRVAIAVGFATIGAYAGQAAAFTSESSADIGGISEIYHAFGLSRLSDIGTPDYTTGDELGFGTSTPVLDSTTNFDAWTIKDWDVSYDESLFDPLMSCIDIELGGSGLPSEIVAIKAARERRWPHCFVLLLYRSPPWPLIPPFANNAAPRTALEKAVCA